MNSHALIGIWGVGVVSPAGVGLPAYRQAVNGQEAPRPDKPAELSFAGACLPPMPVKVLDDFDAKHYLGAKGLSSIDRTTQFTILGADLALQDGGFDLEVRSTGDFGVVLGSASGSIRSIADFATSTYASDPPYTVSAMDFPKTVMNSAAGQCAIRHKLTGLNSTICAGSLSSMLAFRYSTLMLRLGRAQVLLTGGVEEFCAWSAWSYSKRSPTGQASALGEGCAMFALANAGSPGHGRHYGDLLACNAESSAARRDAEASISALDRCMKTALDNAGISAASLRWWSGCADAGPYGTVESAGVGKLLGARTVDRIDSVRHNGDLGSASTALQLATAIAKGADGPGIITGTSPDGQVGCLVVNLVQ